MLFKSIRQPVQQRFPLTGVVRLVFAEGRQIVANAQQVEPAAAPGAVLEHRMQIGSGHQAAPLTGTPPPAQALLAAEGMDAALEAAVAEVVLVAGLRMDQAAEAVVQFKTFDLQGAAGGPQRLGAALAQGFIAGIERLKRQQAQPSAQP